MRPRFVAPALFVALLLPRFLEPTSRANLWYQRSLNFYEALSAGDWVSTYQRYHPGVLVMWLSGASMNVFGWWHGASTDAMRVFRPDATEAGVMGLALVIAAVIVASSFLIARLTNPAIGITTGLLIAIDPMHIAYSKVLHLDALVSSLTFLALLLLIAFGKERHLWLLVLAGVTMGLAAVTKVPSLILAPVAAAIILHANVRDARATQPEAGLGPWTWVGPVAGQGLLLMAIIAGVWWVLFPAMWVEPGAILERIYDAVAGHVRNEHSKPVFWNGEARKQDPGVPFYLWTLAWRTTWITLPMAVVGIAAALLDVRRKALPFRRELWWALLFGVYFTLQMGISAKKAQKYILPVFPVLDLFAAVGLWQTAELVSGLARENLRAALRWGVLAVPIVIQAFLVARYHPTYGLHYNPLLGDAAAANRRFSLQQEADGITLAGEYLNGLPNAHRLAVAALPPGPKVLGRTFDGTIVSARMPFAADYRVYHQRGLARGVLEDERYPAWRQQWTLDKDREAVWTYQMDGVTYVWVYEATPAERRRERERRRQRHEKRKGSRPRG